MCTLTFIPRDDGYVLAMNRDEQITRGLAMPPTRVQMGVGQAVYPTDIEGGTWIGANDHGLAFGLLNRNPSGPPLNKTRSRAEIIPPLAGLADIEEAQAIMQNSDLGGILPFRLIGISATEKALVEWQWDQRKLETATGDWHARHWFSSSLSDEQARAWRGAVCNAAWSQPDAGSLPWVRRLHASHGEGEGRFSICVHRTYVETLSYTEIVCTADELRCEYFSGSPCRVRGSGHSISLTRLASQNPCARV